MKYYKHEGVIIAAKYQPMVVAKDSTFLIKGVAVDMSHVSKAFENGLSVSFSSGFLQPWEEVDLLEYKLYMAERFDYLDAACRNDEAGMWALNSASEHTLRLGGNWPEDGQSIDFFMDKGAKIALIAKTQHWFSKDRPRQTESNSTWSKWVMRKRKIEPFKYIG